MLDAKRRLVWHWIVIVLLALVGGAFVQSLANPRLGLSAHVGGVMNGTLVAVIGAVWAEFALSPGAARVLFWSALYSGYVNWAGLLLAAIFGTSRSTPMLGAGHVGTPWQEALVNFCLTSGAVVIIVALILVLAGLRAQRSSVRTPEMRLAPDLAQA
jgi:hydroxylaminobenzene mutase